MLFNFYWVQEDLGLPLIIGFLFITNLCFINTLTEFNAHDETMHILILACDVKYKIYY